MKTSHKPFKTRNKEQNKFIDRKLVTQKTLREQQLNTLLKERQEHFNTLQTKLFKQNRILTQTEKEQAINEYKEQVNEIDYKIRTLK